MDRSEGVTSTITIYKRRIDPDQRMAAKALLLAHFPSLLQGGQMIIHFGPGRNPMWVEMQERADDLSGKLQKVS